MIASSKKATLKWAAVALALTLVVGCSGLGKPNPGQNPAGGTSAGSQTSPPTASPSTLVYRNTEYGFNFSLPDSWKGYSVIKGQWTGNNVKTNKIVATGPQISLRDPRWTSQNPRQDIPIMIFTSAQWSSLRQGDFHIGAAPINPSELGHNSSYVFALPARYNYAFPAGYKEVEQILAGHPLQATEPAQAVQTTDPNTLLLLNMMQSATAGQVINNSSFSAKTTNIGTVEQSWGKPDQTDWVASADGIYATYSKHDITFGFNKGGQIFEVRSFARSSFSGLTLTKAEQVLGSPAYNATVFGQKIIGYTAGPEFKLELVFPQPTGSNPNPTLDHYNVLYPRGTVNMMANGPGSLGRQW